MRCAVLACCVKYATTSPMFLSAPYTQSKTNYTLPLLVDSSGDMGQVYSRSSKASMLQSCKQVFRCMPKFVRSTCLHRSLSALLRRQVPRSIRPKLGSLVEKCFVLVGHEPKLLLRCCWCRRQARASVEPPAERTNTRGRMLSMLPRAAREPVPSSRKGVDYPREEGDVDQRR